MSENQRVKPAESELKDKLVNLARVAKVTKEVEHLVFLPLW